jgi:integrase
MSHRVPLAETALTILKNLKAQRDQADHEKEKQTPFVFYGARRPPEQREAKQTFGITDFKGHDLRRTAASLMTGSGTSRLVVSKVLNHVESGVTAVYDRHSYDAEKRTALEARDRALATILEGKKATVLTFAKG